VNWGRHFTDPLITLGKAANLAFRYLGVYPGGYHTLDFVIAVPVLALAVYAIIKFRPIYGIYTLVAVIVPLTSIFEGRPLLSFSRYALPIFPLFWALAKWTADRPVRHDLTVAASAALLGLMTLLYVNWYYIL